MINKKLLCALALSASCANSFAADWHFIGGGKDVIFFVDAASVDKKGTYASIWTAQVYPDESVSKDNVKIAKLHVQIQCKNKTAITLTQYNYSPSGAPTKINTFPYQQIDIVPDTYLDNFRTIACMGKPTAIYVKITDDLITASQRGFAYLNAQDQPPGNQ